MFNFISLNVSDLTYFAYKGPTQWNCKSLIPYCRSGVYVLWNKIRNKGYVGSSKEISVRWGIHYNGLIKNSHYNPKLQNAWNKYGEDAFEFCVLQYCEEGIRTKLETERITKLNSYKNGYNQTSSAEIVAEWTDERKIEHGRIMKELYSDQQREVLAKLREDGLLYTDQWKANQKIRNTERNKSEKQIDAVKDSWTDERRKERSELNIEHNKTPQMRKVASANGKKMFDTDKHKAEMVVRNKSDDMRNKVKAAWTPKRREEQATRMKKAREVVEQNRLNRMVEALLGSN